MDSIHSLDCLHKFQVGCVSVVRRGQCPILGVGRSRYMEKYKMNFRFLVVGLTEGEKCGEGERTSAGKKRSNSGLLDTHTHTYTQKGEMS